MNMNCSTVSDSKQSSGLLNAAARKYLDSPTEEGLSEVFKAAKGLIYHFISLYGCGLNKDDMFQAGSEGLMKALKRYDPNSANSFTTYACCLIIGEIRHYVRKENSYYVPPVLRTLQNKIDDVVVKTYEEKGELPTEENIAQYINVKAQGVPEIMRAGLVPYEELNLKKVATAKYETFKLPVEDKLLLETAIKKLNDLQKKVIYMIFYDGMTQEQAASKLGLNQRTVSRLKKSGLEAMRESIDE